MKDENKIKSSAETQGYKKLKVYGLAHDLAIRSHRMTLKLPKFEMMEEGSQIRRSSKSVSSNIVEGYGLRRYEQEYIHYLTCSLASSLETTETFDFLFETESLKDKEVYGQLIDGIQELNSMLYKFVEPVESHHDAARVGRMG